MKTQKVISTLASAFLLISFSNMAAAESQFEGHLKSVTITDKDGTNTPPSANFTFTNEGENFTFDASGSTDSDGSITQYKWKFGDGSTATGESVSHTITNANTPVTLTVVDDSEGIALYQALVSPSLGGCSSVPFISQTVGGSQAKVGNFSNTYYQGTTYNGPAIANVCRIDIGMKVFSGDISGKNFSVSIHDLDGKNNSVGLSGATGSVSGSAVQTDCSLVSFTFDSPVTLQPGSAITVSVDGTTDSDNYASVCTKSFTNLFADGELATWNKDSSLRKINSSGSDLMFQVYAAE